MISMGGMRYCAMALCALLLWVGRVPAAAQTRNVLAVADFADEGADGRLIQASRLSRYLQEKLQALAGDRLQTVAGDEVRAAMRTQGVAPLDLLSRSRAATLATAIGASRIVIGTWHTLSVSAAPDDPGSTPRGSEHMATAIFDMWLIDGTSGGGTLQATFVGRASGLPIKLALLQAAPEALNQAVKAIAEVQ